MEISIAILVTILLSALIGFIEVKNNSDSDWKSCLTISFFIYLIILSIGNTATTLTAFSILSKPSNNMVENNSNTKKNNATESNPLELLWFWSAFTGVFGFEIMLKNINLTFSDKGVLSINDWINKALDSAVASAIASAVNSNVQTSTMLVGKLRRLSENELNAYVVQFLGQERLTELENTSPQNNIDSILIKALAITNEISNADLSQLISLLNQTSQNDDSP